MSSKNNETRTRILNASWKLLESHEGSGVRMSDIAKQAGISRQALYLHFKTRADLLIATTRHLDVIKDVDVRLIASRTATSGLVRLDAYIEAWGGYIPEIYGIAKALLAVQDTDADADAAWKNRMQAVRHGCAAAINALAEDKVLSPDLDIEDATDILAMLLSVRNWEMLTKECGWTQDKYLTSMKRQARLTLTVSPKR